MKRFIVNTLFNIGDYISYTKLMNYELFGRLYNWLMITSEKLDTKWNTKLWKDIKE